MVNQRPTRLDWCRKEYEGAVYHEAFLEWPLDLHFSIWINERTRRARHWVVELNTWIGSEDEPLYSYTVRLPSGLPPATVETRVLAWKNIVTQRAADRLSQYAAALNSLAHS